MHKNLVKIARVVPETSSRTDGKQTHRQTYSPQYFEVMARNNTMNNVHVAATELQQLLKQKTDTFGEATAQKPLSDFVQL